ncbi:MAG: acyl-CoA thioesterase [Haloferacaceae archaeon]
MPDDVPTDLDEFEFVTDLRTRFRDIDSMGHVNNAVYATYLEQARADYFAAVIGRPLHAVDTVLVSLEVEFRAPIDLGETVSVGLTVPDLGESSIPMAYAVHGDEGPAAVAETVQVPVDDDGNARPVPEDWRTRIRDRRESGG